MKGRGIVLLDLFSGTGGFALGLIRAGFTFRKHYFSEVDQHAIANYRYNFKHATYAGPVESVKKGKIETPDIVTFGFPCQDLSVAGKQKGLKGKRSGLFFEALRIIRELEPRVIVFENVKGLLSSNRGRDFETVIKEIAHLGLYNCQWQLLNTAWFLPQNRERVYFVGTLGDKPAPKIFPFTEGDAIFKKGAQKGKDDEGVATAITGNYAKGVHARGETYVDMVYWKNSKDKWVRDKKKNVPTLKAQSDLTRQPLLSNGEWQTVKRERSDRAKAIRKKNRKKGKDYAPFGEKSFSIGNRKHSNTITATTTKDNLLARYDQYDSSGKNHRSQHSRVYHLDGLAPAQTTRDGTKIYSKDKLTVRRLTPLECERLQGFPDNWTKYGIKDGKKILISDTQRYRMTGNAVSVPVVEAVGTRLKPWLS